MEFLHFSWTNHSILFTCKPLQISGKPHHYNVLINIFFIKLKFYWLVQNENLYFGSWTNRIENYYIDNCSATSNGIVVSTVWACFVYISKQTFWCRWVLRHCRFMTRMFIKLIFEQLFSYKYKQYKFCIKKVNYLLKIATESVNMIDFYGI